MTVSIIESTSIVVSKVRGDSNAIRPWSIQRFFFFFYFVCGMIISSESPDFPGKSRRHQNCMV